MAFPISHPHAVAMTAPAVHNSAATDVPPWSREPSVEVVEGFGLKRCGPQGTRPRPLLQSLPFADAEYAECTPTTRRASVSTKTV